MNLFETRSSAWKDKTKNYISPNHTQPELMVRPWVGLVICNIYIAWKASKYNLTKSQMFAIELPHILDRGVSNFYFGWAKREILSPLSEASRIPIGKVWCSYGDHYAIVNICEIRNRPKKLFLNIFQIHIHTLFDIRAKAGKAGQFQVWPPLGIMFPYVHAWLQPQK